MSDQQYAYPFDPTGQESSNLIVNERHVINPPDYSDYYFVVPLVAPFFQNNLVVRHFPSGRELIEGVDFVLGYQFLGASRATGRSVYGAISLYDREITGTLEITYQTLGGMWAINEEKAAEMLANAANNPRITTWEQVVEQPATFPVIDHEWDLDDLVGMSEVNEALDAIRAAIESGGSQGNQLTDHINNENNPHNVTKAQVGLSLVQNYPVASILEAREGLLNDRYMTPIRVADAIAEAVGTDFANHVTDFENPHQVTKAQVGLSSVANYPVADEATARTGASESHYITPAGVSALLAEKVGSGVAEHLVNYDNPHGVTASQVGLGSVPNFPMATTAVAEAGNAVDYFMSPYHTKLLVNVMASQPLGNHLSDYSNPHNVTKDQVGLGAVNNYPVASEAEAEDATALDRYMTPYAVRLAINALVGGSLADHPTDTTNPHNVTKAQVGLSNVANYPVATAAEMSTGTATNRFVTPALVATYVAEGVGSDLSAHEGRTDNPHGVTKAQVGLGSVDNYATTTEPEAREGLRNDRFMTPQSVRWSIDSYISVTYGNLANRLNTLETTQGSLDTRIDDHVADTNNPHGTTIEQLEGYRATTIDDLLLQKLDATARAADSERLDGLTRDEIVNSIELVASETYVTNEEITILNNNLITSFEDSTWGLADKNVIRLEQGNLAGVFTQTTDKVLAMDGNPSGHWLAGGTGGLLGLSTDNGLGWSPVSTPFSDDILFIENIYGNVWVLATATGAVYRSFDGGASWAASTMGADPLFAPVALLTDNNQKVVLVGQNAIRVSNDEGQTFGSTYDLSGRPAIADATLDGTTYYLATAAGVYTWTDSTGVATLVAGVDDTSAYSYVASDGEGRIVAVQSNGVYHRYSPVNNGWQVLEHSGTIKQLVVDGFNLWAALTTDDRVIRSIDGGKYWAEVPTTPDGVVFHSLATSETGWMVAGAGGDLYISID